MEMRRVLYLGWNVGNSLGLLPWVNKRAIFRGRIKIVIGHVCVIYPAG
jgi:hypothetical protein